MSGCISLLSRFYCIQIYKKSLINTDVEKGDVYEEVGIFLNLFLK